MQGRAASIIKLVCSNIVYSVWLLRSIYPRAYTRDARTVLQPVPGAWTGFYTGTGIKARVYVPPRGIILH